MKVIFTEVFWKEMDKRLEMCRGQGAWRQSCEETKSLLPYACVFVIGGTLNWIKESVYKFDSRLNASIFIPAESSYSPVGATGDWKRRLGT